MRLIWVSMENRTAHKASDGTEDDWTDKLFVPQTSCFRNQGSNAWVNENPDRPTLPPAPPGQGGIWKSLAQMPNNTPTLGDALLSQNIS